MKRDNNNVDQEREIFRTSQDQASDDQHLSWGKNEQVVLLGLQHNTRVWYFVAILLLAYAHFSCKPDKKYLIKGLDCSEYYKESF